MERYQSAKLPVNPMWKSKSTACNRMRLYVLKHTVALMSMSRVASDMLLPVPVDVGLVLLAIPPAAGVEPSGRRSR